jgi:hypothetical protein
MSQRFAPYLADPTWYRVIYAQGVHGLLVYTREKQQNAQASDGEDPDGGQSDSQDADERDALSEDVKRVRHLLRLTEKPGVYLAGSQAEQVGEAIWHMRTLLQATLAVLDAAGWHWALRRPPRYVRRAAGLPLVGGGSPARHLALAEFLEGTVEPSAVIALYSMHLEAGDELVNSRELDHPLDNSEPADRREALEDAPWPSSGQPRAVWDDHQWPHEDWLHNYVAELVADRTQPNFSRRQSAEARVGRTKRRPRQTLSYRVEHSLACLLARLGDNQRSYQALQRAFDKAPGPERRRRLAHWSWEDPALAPLRADYDRFEQVAGQALS